MRDPAWAAEHAHGGRAGVKSRPRDLRVLVKAQTPGPHLHPMNGHVWKGRPATGCPHRSVSAQRHLELLLGHRGHAQSVPQSLCSLRGPQCLAHSRCSRALGDPSINELFRRRSEHPASQSVGAREQRPWPSPTPWGPKPSQPLDAVANSALVPLGFQGAHFFTF